MILSTLPMRPGRAPRAWQVQCVEAIREGLRAGLRRVLASAATGTGKSTVIAALSQIAVRKGGRALILTNRRELVEQLHEAVRLVEGSAPVGVVMAARDEWDFPIVVASVQSVTPKRFPRMGTFSLVICDEAHHAVAPGYARIFAAVTETNPRVALVGLTATPFRSGPDGTTYGLGSVFEALVFEHSITSAIRAGDLVPVRGVQVHTHLDLSTVEIAADGDYDLGQLARLVDTPERNRLVVDKYLEHGTGRPTLVFAASIAHAQYLDEAFKARGVNAGVVWGDMPAADRRFRIAVFRDHHDAMPVLISRDLLLEGFDAPATALLLKARPTRSAVVFVQMAGRGLRTLGMPAHLVDPAERRDWIAASAKPDCILVDLVDNGCPLTLETVSDLSVACEESDTEPRPIQVGDRVTRRHSDAWGVGRVDEVRTLPALTLAVVRWPPSAVHRDGTTGVHPVLELARVPDEALVEPVQVHVPGSLRVREYETFRITGTDAELAWYAEDGLFVVGGALPAGGRIVAAVRAVGAAFEVWTVTDDAAERLETKRTRVAALTWAEAHLAALRASVAPVDAPWRSAPASGSQAGRLRSLGRHRSLDGVSAGEASAMIDAAVAARAIRKAEDPVRFERAERVRMAYRERARERFAAGGGA